ncbi:MAG: flippase-like domain-containing protein [Brachybacterium sp.]|uniref:lysylphosphatidylglycerol synthase domain-containing protein n=1 Tax=Brachybacterium sp. TaxID=1891286 RepID=UPI0026489C26|nr:lysylphosphatidylglycerol synthase domain-containing protein [Brachybacterium sp.]MDN5688429.1 flippase-like domain-containing protein [Brachybacterium sp.]
MSAAPDGSPDTPAPEPAAGQGPAWVPSDLDLEHRPTVSPGKIVTGVLSLLLVVAVLVWGLPWVVGVNWAQIGAALAAVPAWAPIAVALLGLLALALEALTVRTAVDGARYPSALLGQTASAGMGLALPGGSVLGLGLLGWILRRSGITVVVIVTGIIAASLVEMVITSILVPLLGLGAYALSSWLAPTGVSLPGALWAGLVAVLGAVLALALTVIVLRRRVLTRLLRRFGELIPSRYAAVILAQRDALILLLRRRAAALLLPTLAARAAQWVALLLAIEAVGAEVPLLLTVAVFALGRVLSLVPVTPGGAGISETVLAAALVGLGVAAAEAAAAMMLMLVATLVVPLLAGAISIAVSATLPARRGHSSSASSS